MASGLDGNPFGFAQSLIDRDPGATLEQIESAREKAHRAPLLMVAIACLEPREPDTPPLERMVSMGAAIQNLLLGAHAMGFGAGLTSGQAMTSKRLSALCGLVADEVPVCCVNIGTVSKRKPGTRVRPLPSAFIIELTGGGPVGTVQQLLRWPGSRCRPGSRRPGAIAVRRHRPPRALRVCRPG